jgi:ubiquinone/menaquinone biosynthesis C-methylase UbiE
MTNTYILNTNDRARKRLSLQHNLYVNSSLSLLREAMIQPGMSGLEIGCGSGDMTIELAKLVGHQGRLLSIDLSKEQIEFAQQRTEPFKQISFKVWDVNQLADLNEQFDFIYCRMVLHHLAHAQDAILQIKKSLKPGGVIICEEPAIFDSTFCFPLTSAYQQFVFWVRTCFSQSNRDFEIAFRLEQEFSACGFSILQHRLYQPLLRGSEARKIYALSLEDISPQLIHLGIATNKEIQDLTNQLLQLAESDKTLSWVRMHQIIAQC